VKGVRLIISEAGRDELAVAGISTGWLAAWLQSAGCGPVSVHVLEAGTEMTADCTQVVVGTESELAGVAMCHGVQLAGKRAATGVRRILLENPGRAAWHYLHGPDRLQTLLLPVGDIACQRHAWLSVLSGGRALLPLFVWPGEDGPLLLEPGLCGQVVLPGGRPPAVLGNVLNNEGLLPEEQLLQLLRLNGLRVRFAESCTGGGMGERLSRMPGSSEALDRSWVTYSNESKRDCLGVSMAVIERCGAVSCEVVTEMAMGGRDTGIACAAVSGIAGPAGGGNTKPVGTVWLAVALPHKKPVARRYCFAGSRASIRAQSVLAGFAMLISILSLTDTSPTGA